MPVERVIFISINKTGYREDLDQYGSEQEIETEKKPFPHGSNIQKQHKEKYIYTMKA
jgi:hypothetical protein